MSATTATPQNALRLKPGGIPLSAARAARHLPMTAVLLIAGVLNVPTFHDYFHGDDYLAFVDMVSKPVGRHILDLFTFSDSDVYWRPLGEVYYVTIWKLFGLNEVAFHAANTIVFLITLCLVYGFCLRAGLGRRVAIGAPLFLALFPNHVVSVSWITNGSRLLAVMFALGSLLLLQSAHRSGKRRYEVLAVVAFVCAGLSDETALVLAPLPLAYWLLFATPSHETLKSSLLRTVPYAAFAAVLVPIQFLMKKDVSGVGLTKFGWHMPEHLWALISKLVLPSTDSIDFARMGPEQWIAGAVALVVLGLGFVFGTNHLRFLIAWIALALLPFTIWVTPIAPARYVYMAAVPFAILVSWAAITVFDRLLEKSERRQLVPGLPASAGLAAALLLALAFFGGVGASITAARDQAYAKDTEQYRLLADGLKSSLPSVPHGSRIVIYYGIWTEFRDWPDAVAKTIYRDPSVRIVNVARSQVELDAPGRSQNDVILYYTGKGFIRAAPLESTGNPR